MPPSLTSLRNPLEDTPSILAVRDIRQRTRQAIHHYRGGGQLEAQLLALDPLTLLRCMRVAHAPISGQPRQLLTIAQLCQTLGRPIIQRALEAQVGDVAGSGPIRKLWVHGIATACAARRLARDNGSMDPEQAYVLGLLHDLPQWLHYLSLRRNGRPSDTAAADWITSWNLPEILHTVIDDARARPSLAPGPRALISAAETHAELAGYRHPDAGGQTPNQTVAEDDQERGRSVRAEVEAMLDRFGLMTAIDERVPAQAVSREGTSLFPTRSRGSTEEVVLSLLECTGSTQYRGILTAMTAAALRYLNFERAFFVQWSRSTGTCFVRAKSDLSPRPLTPTRVQPSLHELQVMERAHASGDALLLRAPAQNAVGLLQLLGCDDALITPLNQSFLISAFLVTDRALSARPIHARREAIGAQSVTRVANLLVHNLLLQRRRERAQKFALTDPLTRLFNRGVGISNLSQEIARARRNGTPLTVLMMDMDDFKSLNDTYGHLAGDEALRRAANVARKALRKADTICRYGGEEFLVILPETSIEEASVSATRLFTAIQSEGEGMGVPLTVSIGLAGVRADDNVESVLSRADRALYASKARGRNRFSVDGG